MKIVMKKIVFLFIFWTCWQAAYAQEFDVVGLKLGMSVAQVYEVLEVFGVDKKSVRENRAFYSYTDGIEQFQTDDFVSYINAYRSKDGKTDSLSIFFSPSPQGNQVVAVTRDLENRIDPLTRLQYLGALKDKYGQPVMEDTSTVQWDFPSEKTQCLVGSVGSYGPAQQSILKKIYGANVGSRDGVLHNQKAKSLSDCASYLTYAMPSGDDSPVVRATAVMVDVAGTADGELSANEWVAGLAEQARKIREAKGAKPEL